MRPWMFAAPIARVVEQRRGQISAGEWSIIPHVHPQLGGISPHLGNDRYGRTAAMQSLGGEDVRLDEAIEAVR